jgi:hypothetical protein
MKRRSSGICSNAWAISSVITSASVISGGRPGPRGLSGRKSSINT